VLRLCPPLPRQMEISIGEPWRVSRRARLSGFQAASAPPNLLLTINLW
jgi:hypothetical protein